METDKSLSELFAQKIFRIPDYQRGFSWGYRQLNELWDDLEDIQIKTNGELEKHYTGTIFIEKLQTKRDEEKWVTDHFYDVVDGQQRLTSIVILLFELLQAENEQYLGRDKSDYIKQYIAISNATDHTKVYRFSYSQDNRNFLLKEIFEDDTVILVGEENQLTAYTNNLKNAKKFFKDKISSLQKEERELLFKKITTALIFDIRQVDNNADLDVQAVFETMNNRGKPLSILEKLKNRLIYLCEKLQCGDEDKSNLRGKINDAWKKIYSNLAKNYSNVLDEDDFLSAHLSLYRKPKDSVFTKELAEKKVFEMFCNKAEKYSISDDKNKKELEQKVDFNKIRNYVSDLADFAELWYNVNNSHVDIINKILLLSNIKDVKIFLCTLQKKRIDINNDIYKEIEKILFRNSILNLGLVDARTFSTWARDIYNNEHTIDDVLSDINNKKSENSINPEDIFNGFKPLFDYINGNKGFHRWGGLKYLLFEYENKLKTDYREEDNKVKLSDFYNTSIEHIMPRNWGKYWNEEMNDYLEGINENDKEQAKKIILNTLGNLTILKDSKNSSIGYDSWKDKKERYSTGSYNEIEISKYEKWDKEAIEQRGLKILDVLLEKLEVANVSDEDKNRILFTDEKYSALKDNGKP